MIKVVINVPDDIREEYLEEMTGESVCLSLSEPRREIACGELQHVDEFGVVIWHMGEARSYNWNDFDEVATFYG